jgi:hypothetical protein
MGKSPGRRSLSRRLHAWLRARARADRQGKSRCVTCGSSYGCAGRQVKLTPLHPSHAADFLVAAQHFSEIFAMRTLCAGYVRARDQPAGLGPVRVTTPRRGHAPQRPQRGAGMEKAQQETCSSPEAVPARGRRPIRAVGAQESAARRRVTPTGELDETSRGRNLRGGRRETPGRAERSKPRRKRWSAC